MPYSQIQRATCLITASWSEGSGIPSINGTAFLIANNLLLTAHHVVLDAEHITVHIAFDNPDSRVAFKARCIAYDDISDAAILELEEPSRDMPIPLPLCTQKVSVNDSWQTYGFPRGRVRTGQTIHGEVIQYDGLPRQTWTLSAHGLSPSTSVGGLSGAACVHEGFVFGIVQRQEGSNVCVVSLANCKELILKSGVAVYDNPFLVPNLAIKDAVRVHDLPPFINRDYIERDDISDLIKEINSSTYLLLSGESFCGKSAIAQRIMLDFWSNGYRYHITDDPHEARRFLNERASSICLLEDPYGHSILNEKSENWKLVRDVCRDVKGNNKLIVTSKTSSLLHAAGAVDLDGCRILSKSWRDLTVTNREFLLNIWNRLQENHADLNPAIVSVIKYHLEHDNTPLLQPGHLNHLAAENSELTQDMSFTRLRHIAMADARELSNGFKERGISFWQAAACLALSSSTTKPVRYDDLYYILNTTTTPKTSFKEKGLGISYGFGRHRDKEDTPVTLPVYNALGVISNDILEALHFFESRGYTLNRGNQWRFTHPQYLEAALYALSGLKVFDQKQLVVGYVEQTISCQNDDVTYQCAEKLPYIYNELKEGELRNQIIDIALQASTRSIFPKTKAKCLIFLLSIFQELTPEARGEIEYLVSSDKISTSNIFWDNGTPFLSEKFRFPWQASVISDADISILKAKFDAQEEISDESVWQLISSGKSVTPRIIRLALNSNEGFIRAQAAIRFFQRYHEFASTDKEEIAKLIFADEYPSVVVEAIKSLIEFCIKLCNSHDFNFLTQLTRSSLSSPFVVLRLKTFIMSFGIDYGSESIDWKRMNPEEIVRVWVFWGDIFPEFMVACQDQQIYFSSGRYSETLRVATEHITPSQGLRISGAVWDWIERTILVRYLDTHELSCVDFFLATTFAVAEERLPLFKRFFLNRDTGLTCYNLKYVLYNWEKSITQEQQFIYELVQSDRPDLNWIQATLFVNYTALSDNLENILFKESNFLKRPVSEIVSLCPQRLLRDSLSMYCGVPDYPFYPYGLNDSNSLFHDIILHILRAELPDIDICLDYFFFHVVNTPGHEWDGWEDIWRNLCANDTRRDYLLHRLIIQTGSSTVNLTSTTSLWSIIHESYTEVGLRQNFGRILFENIEVLENTGHIEDLTEIIPFKVWLEDIFPNSPYDLLFISTLMLINNTYRMSERASVDPTETINELIDAQSDIFIENPVKLRVVSVYTRNVLSHMQDIAVNSDKLLNLAGIGRPYADRHTDRKNQYKLFPVKDWFFAAPNQSIDD